MAGDDRVWLSGDGDVPLFAGLLAGDMAELPSEGGRTSGIAAWVV
jgi:hypothetical protein